MQNAWNRDTKSAAEQKDLEAQKADKLTEVQKLTEQMKNIEETKKNLQEKSDYYYGPGTHDCCCRVHKLFR